MSFKVEFQVWFLFNRIIRRSWLIGYYNINMVWRNRLLRNKVTLKTLSSNILVKVLILIICQIKLRIAGWFFILCLYILRRFNWLWYWRIDEFLFNVSFYRIRWKTFIVLLILYRASKHLLIFSPSFVFFIFMLGYCINRFPHCVFEM